jgi:hypothetical protein
LQRGQGNIGLPFEFAALHVAMRQNMVSVVQHETVIRERHCTGSGDKPGQRVDRYGGYKHSAEYIAFPYR